MSRSLFLLALPLAAAVAGAGAEPPQAPPPRPLPVEEWVKQLGSEDFAEREAATKRLSTLNVDEVPPELLAALKSESPEVRDRAARAIKALREHIALTRLPRGERFAKKGRIDLYVAATAALDLKADDERLWVPTLKLWSKLIALDDMVPGFPKLKGISQRGRPVSAEHFADYRRRPGLEFIRIDGLHNSPGNKYEQGAIQAAGVKAKNIQEALIVSRGPVTVDGGTHGALILANGDLRVKGTIAYAVVICDGDIDMGGVFGSIVIARGKIVKARNRIESGFTPDIDSTLIAGGAVTESPPKERRVPVPQPLPAGLTPKDIQIRLERQAINRKHCDIREHDSRPFGYITFFELSAVGLEVKVSDKQVTVAKVAEGQPFAAAGVKPGDVVAAVNGKTPDGAESLRRLLRDALALGDATLTLKRGDRTETVKVSLPE